MKKLIRSVVFLLRFVFMPILTFYLVKYGVPLFYNFWGNILIWFSVISLGLFNFNLIQDFFYKLNTLPWIFKDFSLKIKQFFSLIKNLFSTGKKLGKILTSYISDGDKMRTGPANMDIPPSSSSDNIKKDLTITHMAMNAGAGQSGVSGGNSGNTQQAPVGPRPGPVSAYPPVWPTEYELPAAPGTPRPQAVPAPAPLPAPTPRPAPVSSNPPLQGGEYKWGTTKWNFYPEYSVNQNATTQGSSNNSVNQNATTQGSSNNTGS